MLRVAPPKPARKGCYLVSPELAEVLTAIIFRVRAGNPARPLLCAYDVFEQTRNPPMPFMFQRRYGNEDRPFGRSYIRECMVGTSQATQITAAGETLEWRPHDLRRIFVTDALRSGLPRASRPADALHPATHGDFLSHGHGHTVPYSTTSSAFAS